MSVFDDSRNFWDAHAARDPLWAVLSDAGKENKQWDVARFFETGVNEISLILYELESDSVRVGRRRALDFGCGVGRLTQALAPHFEEVVGVDVSPGMIDTATALNRFPERVSYVANAAPSLETFPDATFDFVYTNLVLQHIVPDLTLEYLREFLRILTPGGVLVFQLPSHQRTAADPVPETVTTAMPDDAYQAALRVPRAPRGTVRPAVEITLEVEVTNTSRFPWVQPEVGAIRLGNHWLDRTGNRMLIRDDGRTSLPSVLVPGQACNLALTIKTPDKEGEYVCQLDLAHEGVRWFDDRNSTAVGFPVTVDGHAPEAEAAGVLDISESVQPADDRHDAGLKLPCVAPGDLNVADPGHFPMHGVHTERVLDVLAACGGDVIARPLDRSCGDDWISYRYFVRRRS